jgi:hypothetical protein
MNLKICSKCHVPKPFSEFSRLAKSRDGYNYWCRTCCLAHSHRPETKAAKAQRIKELRRTDPDFRAKEKRQADKWRLSPKGKITISERNKRIRKTPMERNRIQRGRGIKNPDGSLFGFDDREKLLVKQDNKCAICGASRRGKTGLQADHNHNTKMIRGLLCAPCNMSLGLLKENIETLRKAIEYLIHHDIL